jgi:hypothetical protein
MATRAQSSRGQHNAPDEVSQFSYSKQRRKSLDGCASLFIQRALQYLPEKAQQAQQLPAAVVFCNAEYLRPYLNAAYANAGSTNPAR